MTAETVPVLPGFAPERVARDNVAHPVPAVGVYMSQDHRYWLNGQGPVPSVTTILGIMDKPAVVAWKAKGAARAMYRALVKEGSPLPEDGPSPIDNKSEDDAVRWAVQEADKERDTAAALGSSVHRLADILGASESRRDGWEATEQEKPYLEAYGRFLAFLEAHRGTIVSSEKAVWSENGYAGTYDLLIDFHCDCHRGLWLIDIKTSKGYYPEYGLQLAGYRWADSIVLPDTPVVYPMPEIQRTGILHLRPDLYPVDKGMEGWSLIEYPTLYEKDYMTFLGALEIWRWREEKRFTKSALTKAQSHLKTGSTLPS